MIFTREFIDHVVDKWLDGYPRENSKRDYEFEKGDTILQDLFIRKMLGCNDLELYLVCEFWCAVSNAVHSSYTICEKEDNFYFWVDYFFKFTELKLDESIIKNIREKVERRHKEFCKKRKIKN